MKHIFEGDWNVGKLKRLEDKYNAIITSENVLEYNSNDIRSIIALGFNSRIIENTQAIIILLQKQNLESTVNIILRNTLEAIIDLDNLANIDGYLDYLAYLDIKDRLRLSNKYYLEQLMRDDIQEYNARKEKLQIGSEISEKRLKDKYNGKFCYNGKKSNNINDTVYFKFYLSESLDTYDTMYYILCGDSHNNLSSIEKSYIDNSMQVKPFKLIEIDEIDRICETLEIILDKSIELINKILMPVLS